MNRKKNILEDLNLNENCVNPFYYKKLDGDYLITNDFGFYHFLKPSYFKKYIEGDIEESSDIFVDLGKKGFIKKPENHKDLYSRLLNKKSRLRSGPGLHIIVTTLRCNYDCVYCQASSKGMENQHLDMSLGTAKKVVDRIFETPNNNINIEFQGGEPMVNWGVVQFIINYARGKESFSNKKIGISLVTNLSLMNEERLQFLRWSDVNICTSLDGPKDLHNKNRPYAEGDSHEEVKKWLEKSDKKKKSDNISALPTISKFSINNAKEIIDEYRSFGYPSIHLRQLSELGKSGGDAKHKIGYEIDDFIKFWKESMDYILEINEKEEFFYERYSNIILTKILTDEDVRFTDLDSPCGAVIGQVVYDYNGNLYSCDEGRMLDEDVFKIGNIDDTSYEEMIQSDVCKTMINASILENQPCDLCVYKPYCGVCPVKNYAIEGSLFPNIKNTDWCKMHTAQFDYLFSKLQEKKYQNIFKKWVDRSRGI